MNTLPTIEEIRKAHRWKREYERYLPLSRYVFRPTGFRLTWLAVRLGATSEAVSWLSAAVGLLGLGGLVSGREAAVQAGLVLLMLFNLFDCVDGSIARAMRTENPYGRFLDSVCGGVVDLGFWAAVGVLAFRHPALLSGLPRLGGPLFWLGVGGATCFMAALLGCVEWAYVELLQREWDARGSGAEGGRADAGRLVPVGTAAPPEPPGMAVLRNVGRNLRVRETHYVLLVIGYATRTVDILLGGYLVYYCAHVLVSLAVYVSRGREVMRARLED